MAGGRSGGRSGGGRSGGGRSGGGSRGHRGGGFHRSGGGFYVSGSSMGGGISVLIVASFFVFVPLVIVFTSIMGIFAGGGYVEYDENTFQDYSNVKYNEIYADSKAIEDNYLLVFLVEDIEYYDFYYMSWLGDHISSDVKNDLGDNDSVLGRSILDNINSGSYKYTLDTDLYFAVDEVTDHIYASNYSSFICSDERDPATSELLNETELVMNTEMLDEALADFAAKTGISITLLIEDMEDVFGKTISFVAEDLLFIVVPLIFVIVGLVLIINTIRSMIKKKKNKNNDNNNNNSSNTGNNGSTTSSSYEPPISNKTDFGDEFEIDKERYKID